MIDTILNGALFGVKGKIWLVILAALAFAAGVVIVIADNAVEDTLNTAKEAGAATAIVEGHKTTLEQTGKANEAGNQVRDNRDNAVYDQCVRAATAATRINCEAFRNEPLPD